MEQDKITDAKLLEVARRARVLSYSPYSEIAVGAALLAESGKVYVGANIENAAFSPSVCAERVAFFRAISDGERKFVKIAISGGRRGDTATKKFAPCGVCRQVMSEFCDGNFRILLESNGAIASYALVSLLPEAFGRDNL